MVPPRILSIHGQNFLEFDVILNISQRRQYDAGALCLVIPLSRKMVSRSSDISAVARISSSLRTPLSELITFGISKFPLKVCRVGKQLEVEISKAAQSHILRPDSTWCCNIESSTLTLPRQCKGVIVHFRRSSPHSSFRGHQNQVQKRKLHSTERKLSGCLIQTYSFNFSHFGED